MKNHTQKLIFTGLLITIGIILSQFLSIPIPPSQTTFKVGIGYLPLMFISLMFGPFYGMFAGIIQDLIGYFLWGTQTGPFHFGFVLNAILFGVLPWFFFQINLFKQKTYKVINIVFAIIVLGVSLYLLTDIHLVSDRIRNVSNTLAYVLVASSIFATLVIGGFIIYMKPIKQNHHLIFIVVIMLVITSVFLTPIWVKQLYGLPYWIQLPPRIIKLPFEAIIYSILLIRVHGLYQNLQSNQVK